MAFYNDLSLLKNREHLLNALGVSEVLFDQVLNFEPPPDSPPVSSSSTKSVKISIPAFFRHRIPKKNKARGYRIAWEAAHLKNDYKALARILNDFLSNKLCYFPHPAVYGYVGGRNIKYNARVHCGHKNLLCADIQDFFPSIARQRIEILFRDTGVDASVSELLSRFVTIDGSLPLGLPTSPVLSNGIFLPADIEFQAFANSLGVTYTRYSDDLSFSGDGELPAPDEIAAILARHGFTMAANKTRTSRRGQAHFVTGLSINDPAGPHVPKDKKHNLRQELYYAHKYGLADHFHRRGISDEDTFQRRVNALDGMVKFVSYHEPLLSSRIKPLWNEILREAGARPSYAPRRDDRASFTVCIDESEFSSPAGPLLCIGLSVSQHQSRLNADTSDVLNGTLGDMWATGNREALNKKGLHFADAHPDLVLAYVKQLQKMPFEGYVCLGKLSESDTYENTYLRLLAAVIRRRLMAAESQLCHFIIEKNEKVSEDKVCRLITSTHAALRDENNRHPKSLHIEFVKKPNLEISVPDFLLGILGRYMSKRASPPDKPESRDRLLFERIRGKYRLILDVDRNKEYSRRNPIRPWDET